LARSSSARAHPEAIDRHLSEDQLMRLTKTLGMAGALIISALVGGTLIGSALATDETTTENDTARGAYCDTFLDAFASELGATRDEVTAAGKAAANAAIDAAVAAGDLSEERAAALRERIAEFDGPDCGLFRAGWVRGFNQGAIGGWARGFLGGDVVEAAADALGIESSAVIEQLRDAGSLEALATELGVSYDEVKAAILAAVQADLDATELSDERKAAVIDRLTNWLDEGGDVGGLRPGRGHGDGPGGGFGPWNRDADESEGDDQGA
jgi:hypothetical protein